jgi:hypothetical protein
MNLGTNKFAETKCKETTVNVMITKGPVVPNCRVAASRGTIPAKTTPKNGINERAKEEPPQRLDPA